MYAIVSDGRNLILSINLIDLNSFWTDKTITADQPNRNLNFVKISPDNLVPWESFTFLQCGTMHWKLTRWILLKDIKLYKMTFRPILWSFHLRMNDYLNHSVTLVMFSDNLVPWEDTTSPLHVTFTFKYDPVNNSDIMIAKLGN